MNPYLPADRQDVDNLPKEDEQEYNEGEQQS